MNMKRKKNLKERSWRYFILIRGLKSALVACIFGMLSLYLYTSIRKGEWFDVAEFIFGNLQWIPILAALGVVLTFLSWAELKEKYGNRKVAKKQGSE